MDTLLFLQSNNRALGWIDAVVGAAGSVATSAINAKTQAKANEATLSQMAKQAEQNLLLSKTQHQQDIEKIKTISKAVFLLGGAAIVVLVVSRLSRTKSIGGSMNGKGSFVRENQRTNDTGYE